MFDDSAPGSVKPVQAEIADHTVARQPNTGSSVERSGVMDDQRCGSARRIKWTRQTMLAIAPECKALPESLVSVPEHLSVLFDVGPSSSLRSRGKGRVGNCNEVTDPKRGDTADPNSHSEPTGSAWQRKDRNIADSNQDRMERAEVKGRAIGEPSWRPRRDRPDEGLWAAPSNSAASVADGWLMPDADDDYQLGGTSNNVEAFEAMRQQARAEWAKAQDVKPVQDSATEDVMNDLLADARDNASNDLGPPPGLSSHGASTLQSGLHSQKIDVQSLFNSVPAAPPGLKPLQVSPSANLVSTQQGTLAAAASESNMRSMSQSAPEGNPGEVSPLGARSSSNAILEDTGLHLQPNGSMKAGERMSVVSSSHNGRGLDAGSLLSDSGVDDVPPGFSVENKPVSQEMPRASSPPSSSPRSGIWGPGVDAGAAGSTLTSTDWSQMQEIWNREPSSKVQDVDAVHRLNDEFHNASLSDSRSVSMTGPPPGHGLLRESHSFGRHGDIADAPAFPAVGQMSHPHVGVSDSLMALRNLLPQRTAGPNGKVHHDAAGHNVQMQHEYTANLQRMQHSNMHQRQSGRMLPQQQGSNAEQHHSFEMYLKQLVANAHQQQQQVGEQQRAQAAASLRAGHTSAVMHPHGHPQSTMATQHASLEQIRKLAPALQRASSAVPQQHQMNPMASVRHCQPQASSGYTSLQEQAHRMQDPTWMLRKLKGTAPQQHGATSMGTSTLQQSWATPTRTQVQYPAQAYEPRGHQAAIHQYGTAARVNHASLQHSNAALQGLYADQLARAALQSAARQPHQQQAGLWLSPQASSQHHQHSVYPVQARPVPAQGHQQAMNHAGQYTVRSGLQHYYPDNTQTGYNMLYRQ